MNTHPHLHIRLLLVIVVAMVFAGLRARAAVLTVTSTANSGTGSLREAVASATDGDTITFDPAILPATIAITSPIIIDNDLRIEGPGDTLLTLDAGGVSGNTRIFEIGVNASVSLSGLTLYNGWLQSDGGGIYNEGTLTINHSTLFQNYAFNGRGGAIFNLGTLTINHSIVSTNGSLYGGGGGIYSEGMVTINNSTFIGNEASFAEGGGIYGEFETTLIITNSTFFGNSAEYGGAIFNSGSSLLTLDNNTFSGNSAILFAGGIYNVGSTLTIRNNTFYANTAPVGGGIYNFFATSSVINTLFGNSACIGLPTGSHNLRDAASTDCPASFGLNPAQHLGGLQDNGGPTLTHALLYNGHNLNPAIDRGNDATCLPTDQRGGARVNAFLGIATVCDIGAFEYQSAPPSFGFTVTPTAIDEQTADTATVTVTPIHFAAGSPVTVYFSFSGTATEGIDYTVEGLSVGNTLTFAPGSGAQSFTISAISDVLTEGNESINLLMGINGTAVITGTNPQTLTLNDGGSATIQLETTTDTVAENAGIQTVQVQYSGAALAAGQQVDFTLTRTNISTTEPDDFDGSPVVASGSFVGGGATTVNINTAILDDALAEGNEHYTLTLALADTTPVGLNVSLGAVTQQTVTITDDSCDGQSAVPDADLRTVGTHLNPPYDNGDVHNSSACIDYTISIAVYKILDVPGSPRLLHDAQTMTVSAGQSINLSINLPECMVEVYLFYGSVIDNLDNETYLTQGRELDSQWLNGTGPCADPFGGGGGENPNPNPEPNPPMCTPNPDGDLKHGDSHLNSPFDNGTVTNLSGTCTYEVGIASYAVIDGTVTTQQLLGSQTMSIAPGQTVNLGTVPLAQNCMTQVDLFYGAVITDFSGGERYGSRLIDVRWVGSGMCDGS